jgi:RNA polymerase sigma factor, sigma-70 family
MTTVSSSEFEHSFKELYRPLCLSSLRITTCLDDAEDIVQQVFTEAWTKLQEGVVIDNLKAYLYSAVRNRSLSLISQKINSLTTEQFADTEDLSEEERVYEAERDARLWNAIEALPPARKEIFLLSKRDGLKYQEIADCLNLSVKTVENQIGKALKSLRDTAVRIYTFFFGVS